MTFNFIGTHKTSQKFIDKLDGIICKRFTQESETYFPFFTTIRVDTSGISTFINKLNIFSSVKVSNNSIEVEEKKRRISFKSSVNMDNKIQQNMSFDIPNIFGAGEGFSLEIFKNRDFNFKFIKPLLSNTISFLELGSYHGNKTLDSKKYKTQNFYSTFIREGIKLMGILEKLDENRKYLCNLTLSNKYINLSNSTGYYNNQPFYKFIGTLKYKFTLSNLFLLSKISTGFINGRLHKTDKFYLGDNIRGYKSNSLTPLLNNKKVGGKGYVEFNTDLGITVRNFNLFCFKSLGFISTENKPEKIFSFEKNDTSSIGGSYGVGLSYIFNWINLGVTYNTPLFDNKDLKKVDFFFDITDI